MTDRPRHAGVLPCSVPKERRQTSKASLISEGAKSGPSARPMKEIASQSTVWLRNYAYLENRGCIYTYLQCKYNTGVFTTANDQIGRSSQDARNRRNG